MCEGATLKDIDEEKVRWFLRKAKFERNLDIYPEIPLKEVLEKLKLIVNNGLSNATILVFGKNPKKFFLQERQFLRLNRNFCSLQCKLHRNYKSDEF